MVGKPAFVPVVSTIEGTLHLPDVLIPLRPLTAYDPLSQNKLVRLGSQHVLRCDQESPHRRYRSEGARNYFRC